jgi:hypothetical protein
VVGERPFGGLDDDAQATARLDQELTEAGRGGAVQHLRPDVDEEDRRGAELAGGTEQRGYVARGAGVVGGAFG